MPSVAVSSAQSVIAVLIVEDDDTYVELAKQVLSRNSDPKFQVNHASSLTAARAYLDKHIPDIILSDLELPDSSGLSTLTQLRASGQGCPVIVLTGNTNHDIGLKAVGLGADDYLIKPLITHEALVRCIQYSVQRRRYEESELRFSAIRDFTSALAHDLKIPLIGNRNVLDALVKGQLGTLSKEQNEAISQLQSSNRTQLQLVEKLLSVYRYETRGARLQEEMVDCLRLFQQAVANVGAGREDEVMFKVERSLPKVLAERTAIMELFENLLENAFKFKEPGTIIVMEAGVREDKLWVVVSNKGPAIPTEIQATLFSNFFNGLPGKHYVTRLGLGLYLCGRIVHLHGGTISCKSTASDGTAIQIELPLSRTAAN